MRIDQPRLPDNSPVLGSETNDPRSGVVGPHAARAFDKQAVERAIQALHKPPNLLAIGDKDPDEVLRHEREAYQQELASGEALRAALHRRLGGIATVHDLPTQQPASPIPNTYLAS